MEPVVRIVCEGCLRSVELATDEPNPGESRCPFCGHLICSQTTRTGPDESETASPRSGPESRLTEVNETIDWFGAWERGTLGFLGRFQLREKLGDGGFGQVFLAFDPRLDRDIAVKVLKQSHPSDRVMERFFREARAVARLDHPNIAAVYDAGFDEGRCWVAYQLVGGRPLWWYRERQRMDVATAARIIRDLADALDHAHRMGVVHRDIKPANIIIDDHGRPRLIDFGLARRFDLGSDLTREGAVVGTPAYMSPEQAVGMSRQADERSDLYSLGVIFYELLCHHRPQEDRTELTVGRPVPSPISRVIKARSIDRSIPVDLSEVCAKAMSTRPSDRYATARALADDLDRWLKRRANSRQRFLMMIPGTVMLLTGFLLSGWGLWTAGRVGLTVSQSSHVSPDWPPETPRSEPFKTTPVGAYAAGPITIDSTDSRVASRLLGNKETRKYHDSHCEKAGTMRDKHRIELGSHEEAAAQGYQPCSYCLSRLSQASKSALADKPASPP